MEAPKKYINTRSLLGAEKLKDVDLNNDASLLLPPVVDNAIFISCKNDGLEIEKEGEPISILMDDFFQLLNNEKAQLNTKEFVNILNARYGARTNGGHISYTPKHSTLRKDYFYLLKGNQQTLHYYKDSKYITWMYFSEILGSWKIDFGEIHGLKKRENVSLVNQKGDFRIIEVLPCQALIDDKGTLDKTRFYQVDFFQSNNLEVEMDLNQSLELNELNKWVSRIEKLIEQWNQLHANASLKLIKKEEELQLEIHSSFFVNPCIKFDFRYCAEFEQIFKSIIEWEEVVQRKNNSSDINIDNVLSINISKISTDDNSYTAIQKTSNQNIIEEPNLYWEKLDWKVGETLHLEKGRTLFQPNPRLRIFIDGKSSEPYFVSVLLMKEADYSVSNSALPYAELDNNTAFLALNYLSGGYQEPFIDISLQDIPELATEANYLLKIFITNDDKLDTDFFCKGKLDINSFKNEKAKAIRTSPYFNLDWTAIDIPIKIRLQESKEDFLQTEVLNFRKEIRSLISRNESKKALELFLEKLDKNSSHSSTTYLQLGRINALEKDVTKGTIRNQDAEIQKAQINNSLLQIVNEIELPDLNLDFHNREQAFLKTQNLLWYLQKFDFLEVSTDRPKVKPQEYTPQKIGETGYFTDPRDGQQYKTVMLKDGKVWLAENLNFDMGEGCWFYDDNAENGEKFGRLYNWDAAQKVCPEGWYMPSAKQWENLKRLYLNNDSGFSSFIEKESTKFISSYSGYRTSSGEYKYLGSRSYFGLFSQDRNHTSFISIEKSTKEIIKEDANPLDGFSLRYIKSNPQDESLWIFTQEANTLEAYQHYIEQYPNGRYTEEAEKQIAKLQEAPNIIIPDTKLKDYTPQKIGETGYFTDPRDGQQYKTVMLKDGKVWMAENLNYDLPSISKKGTFNKLLGRKQQVSWFYNDDPKNGDKHGRLYTWESAQQACPKGWHVPSDEEWQALANAYGGYYDWGESKEIGDSKKSYKALLESGISGFSAQLGGRRTSSGSYVHFGEYGYYWSSTEYDADKAWYYNFDSYHSTLLRYYNKTVGRSCRCLKD